MDARVVALEQRFASLETRFEVLFAQLNGMRSGSDSGAPAAIEIAALQRNIDRLTVDLQRVQRLADAAQREAAQARREAAAAELLARQADTRIR
jgi:hypothetical protein